MYEKCSLLNLKNLHIYHISSLDLHLSLIQPGKSETYLRLSFMVHLN